MQVFIKVMILHIFTPLETALQIYPLPKTQFFTVYKLPCTLVVLLAFNYCPKCIRSTVYSGVTVGLLICTLISENLGLEKSRSVPNLRKISGPAHLIFFSVHLSFFSVCHLDIFRFMV